MISRYKFVFSLKMFFQVECRPLGINHLFEKEDKVEDEVNFALSAFILAVSLFFVSEN